MGLLILIALAQLVVSVLILSTLMDLAAARVGDPVARIDRLQHATLRDLYAAEAAVRESYGASVVNSSGREVQR